MEDNTTRHCEECGCEILQEEDIGYEYAEKEYRLHFAMLKSGGGELFSKPFVVCVNCSEETERLWEEFKKTPEGQYECEFNKWANKEMEKVETGEEKRRRNN